MRWEDEEEWDHILWNTSLPLQGLRSVADKKDRQPGKETLGVSLVAILEELPKGYGGRGPYLQTARGRVLEDMAYSILHAFESVKRCTTTRPKLDCGQELYSLAKRLLKAKGADKAAAWLADYAGWCTKWERFLREFTLKDGKKQYTHERLRKARNILNRLVKEGTMFTFVELQEELGGIWESTNNAIEGGVNAQIRKLLRNHSGMATMHRIKAVFWWCYMHTECPLAPSEILRVMPTDDQVDGLFASASSRGKQDGEAPEEYGSGIVWSEFHMPADYRQ